MIIKINKYKYRINETNNPRDKRLFDGKRYKVAVCDLINQKILIYNKISKARIINNIIHELIHAYIDAFGIIELSEEIVCEFFAAHGKDIVKIADNYINKRGKYNGEKKKQIS